MNQPSFAEMFSTPDRMCGGSLLRQRRQSAFPTVLSKSQRGQLRFFASTATWSLVRCTKRFSHRLEFAAGGDLMTQRVTFPSNGHTCQGAFALPPSGRGPAVVVIQEWWGLVPHIDDLVDRFAAEGFVTIAPDLYHGKTTTSPDEAGKLLMELDVERAAKEIGGAGDYVLSRPECTSEKFGVVGFCMGGALAQYVATSNPKVGAAVSFYGGFKKVETRWENLDAPILLIYGE